MLNVSNNPASTNSVTTLQHVAREVRAFDNMRDDTEADLLAASYCLDAPTLLPAGVTSRAVTDWTRRP